MKTMLFFMIILVISSLSGNILTAHAGPPLQPCGSRPQEVCGADRGKPSRPECGIELTCTDKPVQLGYSDGVCFRATCPGIWGLVHVRADQNSFRRRLFAYRHYAFKGHWELKDQGVVEAGPVPVRELFLVLPDDLIEFKLNDPDCLARVEIKKLGYVKTGTLPELQEWLAYNAYLEKADRADSERTAGSDGPPLCGQGDRWLGQVGRSALNGLFSVGRVFGLRFPGY